MYSYCEHGNNTALKTVAEYEGGAAPLLHVERDTLQATHMEEGLVLDSCKARVMQEPAIHVISLLEEVVLVLNPRSSSLLGSELSIVEIVRVLDNLDRIVTSLWVKATFH